MRRQLEQLEEAIDNAAMLARLARDLPSWLRRPVTLDAARARIRAGLAARDARFLAFAARAIYAYRRSPYRALLAHAGCELGDLRRLVASEGLEGALASLAAHGVYVTVDEMKGAGRSCVAASRSRSEVPTSTIRSRRRTCCPTRVDRAAGRAACAARSVLSTSCWTSTWCSPTSTAIAGQRRSSWVANTLARILRLARVGVTTMHWLYPVHPLSWQIRALSAYASMLARLAGHRLPGPVYLGLDEHDAFAEWLADYVARAGPVLCVTTPSSAVRAAVAVTTASRSLTDVTFVLRGEALTDARRRDIEAIGAYVFSVYGAEEVDAVAASCAAGIAADDGHVMTHRLALIGRNRPVWEGGPVVRALQVTTLTGAAPKICLNADMGDCGDIEERDPSCCGLGSLGLTTHLANVRSFEKLTGEGMTVVGASFLRLIEEVLHRPRRGLAVVANYLTCDGWRVGFPRYLLSRVALTHQRVDDAIAAVRAIPRARSRNRSRTGPATRTRSAASPRTAPAATS